MNWAGTVVGQTWFILMVPFCVTVTKIFSQNAFDWLMLMSDLLSLFLFEMAWPNLNLSVVFKAGKWCVFWIAVV